MKEIIYFSSKHYKLASKSFSQILESSLQFSLPEIYNSFLAIVNTDFKPVCVKWL